MSMKQREIIAINTDLTGYTVVDNGDTVSRYETAIFSANGDSTEAQCYTAKTTHTHTHTHREKERQTD